MKAKNKTKKKAIPKVNTKKGTKRNAKQIDKNPGIPTKKTDYKKILKITGKVLYNLVFVFLVLIAFIVVLSSFNIPGNIKMYTVQSGSMEPTIHTGSIVVIKPMTEYLLKDIITVVDPENSKMTITHRIAGTDNINGMIFFTTKGDANNAPDNEKRLQSSVLGKEILSIPLLGYIVGFEKTMPGLVILIIIPATIIIYSEMISIKNEAKRLLEERKKKKLTTAEKIEVEIGEEEIKVGKWYRKAINKIHIFFMRDSKK